MLELLLQAVSPRAVPSVAGAAGEQWEWECRHGVARGETTPSAPRESHYLGNRSRRDLAAPQSVLSKDLAQSNIGVWNGAVNT